jgi:CheY-like chemotaxis protein
MSGLEALRILAEEFPTAHIPVIALSANAMPRDVEKGLQAGFFRYLTKPIKVAELMETIDLALLSTVLLDDPELPPTGEPPVVETPPAPQEVAPEGLHS